MPNQSLERTRSAAAPGFAGPPIVARRSAPDPLADRSTMEDAAITLGLAHCAMGLVLIGISVPLILRRVKMNPLYGVRIPKAFESEVNWYAINEFGGKVLAASGAAIALVGVLALVIAPSSLGAIVLLASAPLPILLVGLVPILRYAKGLR